MVEGSSPNPPSLLTIHVHFSLVFLFNAVGLVKKLGAPYIEASNFHVMNAE
jgi:hypothetical protein